jgi:hypothetical protein
MHVFGSVEINAVLHCNLRCVACNHDAPSMPSWFADPDVVFQDLTRLREVARVETVRVVGGEPLPHPRLPALLRAVRAAGIAKQVSLFTNGLLAERVDPLVWEQLDHILLTVYPGTQARVPLAALRAQAQWHRITLDVLNRTEFTVQFRESACVDDAETQRVFQTCNLTHGRRCYAVHEGRFFRCPQAMVLPRRPGALALACETDSVHLNRTDLDQALDHYLRDTRALDACRLCYGTDGAIMRHHSV